MDMKESSTSVISGIITQGHAFNGRWTESYKVKYSDNGVQWIYVTGADGSPLKVSNNGIGLLALFSIFQ